MLNDEQKLAAALLRGISACQSEKDVMTFARQPEAIRSYAKLTDTNKVAIKKAMRDRVDELNKQTILDAG